MQNPIEIKEKILRTLRIKGPSIPVHIAREVGQSILFASAFLSELFAEKKIKQSNLRVGSSPVYFLQGQEPMLEKFSSHLKSREKDAFALLKEKKFLIDDEQEPAIRVALRAIKDFAVIFQKEDKLIWRYFTIPEDEFKKSEKIITTSVITQKENTLLPKLQQSDLAESAPRQPITSAGEPKLKEFSLNIFDKPRQKKEKPIKKIAKKKPSQNKNDKFFNRVKESLFQKNIEIIDIQSFSKDELVLKIRENNNEKLLLAYNKKRITETDLAKAHKKAQSLNLKYVIFNLGETPKKIDSLIAAVRNLDKIEKIE
jgi:hypothetical protein